MNRPVMNRLLRVLLSLDFFCSACYCFSFRGWAFGNTIISSADFPR